MGNCSGKDTTADSGCSVCKKPITDSTVITYRDKRCHKACFKCSKCKKQLDLNGFKILDDKLYCVDCYNKDNGKKCAVCKEPLTGKYYPCGDKLYHEKCFKCKDCGKSVVDGYNESPPGATHDIGVFCPKHYYDHFGDNCSACGKKIQEKSTVLKDFKYHPECFACCVCKKQLDNGKYHTKYDDEKKPPKIYCDKHYDELFGQKCCKCNKPLEDKFVTANNKNYHHKCFKCEFCGKVIDSNYVTVDNKICCPKCKK